jgi:hypothetical protein
MEIPKEDIDAMLELVNKVNTDTEDNALTLIVIRRIKEILTKQIEEIV